MDIAELQKLCTALESLLQPEIDYATRIEALQLCEAYKSDPRCAEVGFHLASSTVLPPNVRYYGLQLIKHRVRMHWTTMSKEEKIAMKSLTFNLISCCSKDEVKYIKSVLGNIINEIVKHIWPQQWPSMVSDVIENGVLVKESGGMEVTILFFLSLAEDVALYQNVNTKSRAKDLRQALSVAAADIFGFLFKILKSETAMLVASQASYHDHLAKVALHALETYVEWINLNLIYVENGAFFETLFHLFSFETLRVAAADCLLVIVSRKGHFNDRMLLIKLTEEYSVQKYAEAIMIASKLDGFTEANFQFLFIIGKIVSALSLLLIGLWEEGEKNSVDTPKELFSRRNFLEIIYFLSNHESKIIAQTVLAIWAQFLRHSVIQKDKTLQSLIPLLVDLASQNLTKRHVVETPFSAFEETCISDSDEIAYYTNFYRIHLMDTLRSCAYAAPLTALDKCFDYSEQCLKSNCENVKEAHIQFDSMLNFLETVLTAAVCSVEESKELHSLPIARGEALLNQMLSMKTSDMVVKRILVSSSYALLKLLVHSNDPVLQFKLLANHLFSLLDDTASDMSNSQISSLRRQICATMVRTAKTYSKIFVNLTAHLKSLILARLDANPSSLFSFEKVAMFESLILISLEWKNLEQQSRLIADVMSTTLSIVKSPEFKEAMQGFSEFAHAIGVDIVPTFSGEAAEPTAELRSNFYYYTALIFAVLNRTQDQAYNDGNANILNPAAPYVTADLEQILVITHLLSAMWSPEIRKLFAPENLKSLELRDCEKRSLICQSSELVKTDPDERVKSHWERLQVFLVLTLDHCYMALGLMGKILGPDFYKIPQLVQIILQKVFGHIEHLPCMRLKSLLRQFLAPFLKLCPIEKVNEVVGPILQAFCQFVMMRLQPAWNAYAKREFDRLQGSDDIDDIEEKEEDEILQEQILRVISREHLELLIALCVNKNPPSHKHEDQQEKPSNGGGGMKPTDSVHVHQLTALGAAIAAGPSCEQVLYSVLCAVTWHDTITCQKAILLLGPLLKQLVQTSPNQFNEELTRFVLQSLLHGLARHGEHDGCNAPLCSLLLIFIQSLKSFQGNVISEVLLSTQPEQSKDHMLALIKDFDSIIEKKRKLQFRKLISNIIIRHASQRFKEIPEMSTFDPIPRRKKLEFVQPEIQNFGLAELFRPTT